MQPPQISGGKVLVIQGNVFGDVRLEDDESVVAAIRRARRVRAWTAGLSMGLVILGPLGVAFLPEPATPKVAAALLASFVGCVLMTAFASLRARKLQDHLAWLAGGTGTNTLAAALVTGTNPLSMLPLFKGASWSFYLTLACSVGAGAGAAWAILPVARGELCEASRSTNACVWVCENGGASQMRACVKAKAVEDAAAKQDASERACKLGAYGECLLAGRARERAAQDDDAASLYAQGCALSPDGDRTGCANVIRLGLAYSQPEDEGWRPRVDREEDVERDTQRGLRYLRAACQAGSTIGCFDVARVLTHYTVLAEDTRREAVDDFAIGCKAKIPGACRELADFYRSGEGVPKDPARAEALLEEARALFDERCFERDHCQADPKTSRWDCQDVYGACYSLAKMDLEQGAGAHQEASERVRQSALYRAHDLFKWLCDHHETPQACAYERKAAGLLPPDEQPEEP